MFEFNHLPYRCGTEDDPPSRITQALVFLGKATLLQLGRAVRESITKDVQRFSVGNTLIRQRTIAESRSPLWTEIEDSEKILLAGKIHNLRLAIRRLNGVEVPAERVFSFWKQVGRTNQLKGYVAGREQREGCLIPNIGGGICQLSNALYDAALHAGFEIVERHAHTQIIPGSLAESGRDATVFWNYVDLRFRSNVAFRIEASLSKDHLTIRLRSDNKIDSLSSTVRRRKLLTIGNGPNSCASCGINSCFRNIEEKKQGLEFGRTAYLVDEYWSEFDEYITSKKSSKDLLGIPINGRKFKKTNYAWQTEGFHKVKERRVLTALRSIESRKLSLQGA